MSFRLIVRTSSVQQVHSDSYLDFNISVYGIIKSRMFPPVGNTVLNSKVLTCVKRFVLSIIATGLFQNNL